MKFSVVIPVYKCSSSLNEITKRLTKTLSTLSNDFEIIYVNDASPENDWSIINKLTKKDKRIKGINLSRNFGQHYAIFVGLEYTKGEWIIVMDGDLQDQPEEIIKLYNKAKEGYDIVFAKRINRQDNFFKKSFSKLFFKFLYYSTNITHDYQVGNFGIYNKRVITTILKMKIKFRIFLVQIKETSFSKTTINVIHKKRANGKSSYTYKKMFVHAYKILLSLLENYKNKPTYMIKNEQYPSKYK